MIYVVQFPREGDPNTWFAYDQDDFVRKVCADDLLEDYQIHDVITPRELLDLAEQTPDSPGVRETFPAICRLADSQGWDHPFYRADYVLGEGVLSPEAISADEAYRAALEQRLEKVLIYWEDSAALAALEADPALSENSRALYARHSLRQQLIALEVLDGVDD